jgi:Ca2+-binding RTX toxin-like protein
VIVGLTGDDVIQGRGGDDLVCGGDGADALRGGPGDDRLYGQREGIVSDRGGTYFVADLLDGGPGDDLLDVGGDARWVNFGSHGYLDYTRARSGVTVDLTTATATGQGSDTIVSASAPPCDDDCHGVEVIGSPYDDVLTGNTAPDRLTGGGGNDLLDGRSGADELYAGAGDAVVHGGAGADFLSAGGGRDQLFGDGGGDTLWATEGGPSELYGSTGDDELVVWFATEPGFVIDGEDGDDNGQLLVPRRPGAGGRPTEATYDGQAATVSAGDTLWGRIAGLEDLYLDGPIIWTCQNRAGIRVENCS